MFGKLTITLDGNTWLAKLDDTQEWDSDDPELKKYLTKSHKPSHYSSIRRAMKHTKETLENRGYSVKLEESPNYIISEIIKLNENICDFWSSAHGWAPTDAAELLAKSRLDRQVSLSYCLRIWLDAPRDNDFEGRLILAWVNLGSLLEGTMKFFLSVYEADYSKSPKMRKKRNSEPEPISPDELKLEMLKQVFSKEIWTDSQKQSFCSLVDRIQERRNAIHAYKDKYIGIFEDFFEDLSGYLDLLEELEGQVPYP